MSVENIDLWKNPASVDCFARQHYRDRYHEQPEFHHYRHAKLTRYIAGVLAGTAAKNGADIKTDVLDPAAAYHDADAVVWPLFSSRFALPEYLAADIAARDLPNLGMPDEKVKTTAQVIRETSRFIPCTTDTARCLSQADLMAGGIFSADLVFLSGTADLYKESKKHEGEPIPEDHDALKDELLNFGDASHGIVSHYLEEDLALGPHQRNEDGESMFNILGRRKIELLRRVNLEPILDAHLGYILDFQPAYQLL